MCGRFALNTTEMELRAHFNAQNSFVFKPKYNLAPNQIVPVIIFNQFNLPELVFMQWGFTPTWNKDPDAQKYINARIETVSEKPTFKQAFLQKRCLIPASGFYEWQLLNGRKQPFYVYLKNQALFGMAGIWAAPTEEGVFPTCAILTESSPEGSKMAAIHERMPVIMSPSSYAAWLNPRAKVAEITEALLLKQMAIACFSVSLQVNSPKFDSPDCIRPLS